MKNGINSHEYHGPVGGSTQDTLNNVFRRHLPFSSAPSGIVIRQVRRVAGTIGRAGPEATPGLLGTQDIVVSAVRPYSRTTGTSTYWQDAGWEMRNGHLIGHYQAGGRLFPGSVEVLDSHTQPLKYYIYNPPTRILNGQHSACFHYQDDVGGTRKYWIHFSEQPKDIDSGIIQIQRDLSHAIGVR